MASNWRKSDRVFGRPSKRASDRIFEVGSDVRTVQCKDPTDKKMLVELRGTGGQTVFPPTTHLSGEQIVWESSGKFGKATAHELRTWCSLIASMAVLAKHWPDEGARHGP